MSKDENARTPTPILVIIIGQVSSAPFSILVLDRFFFTVFFSFSAVWLSFFFFSFPPLVFVRFLHLQLRTNSRSPFKHGCLFKRVSVPWCTTDFHFCRGHVVPLLDALQMALQRQCADFYHHNHEYLFSCSLILFYNLNEFFILSCIC